MKKLFAILFALCLVLAVCAAAYGGTYSEDFNDAALSDNFGTSTNSAGAVTETTSLLVNAPAGDDTNAAIVYYKGVSPDRASTWSASIKAQVLSSNPALSSLRLYLWTLPSGTPATVANADLVNKNSITMFFSLQSGTYELYIGYKPDSSTGKFWNNGAGTWDSSFVKGTTSFTGALDTEYIYIIESDGTNATMEIQNASETTLWGPASVPWSGVMSNTVDYIVWGEALNDFFTGAFVTSNFTYSGPEIGAATTTTEADPDTSGTYNYWGNTGTSASVNEGTIDYE